ncbi:MAG: lipopolysaccharide biosynthesis protein [Gaiellaceae bacterium]
MVLRSRVLRRRAATAFGIYGAALVGFLATIVAARELSKYDFARFAVVFAVTSLLQLFVDLTIDEVVVKYGNRYAAREDWGRFRRLFEIGLAVKMAGGAAGSLAIVAAAFLAPHIWSTSGLRGPMLIASLIPLIQQPEGMAGAVLLVRNRYDLRGLLLFWSMLLRLVAIAVSVHHGVMWVFAAIVVAQAVSSATVCAVAYAAYRRYPRAPRAPLGADAAEIRAFAIQSTIASGLTSLRTSLPTVLVGIVSSSTQVANFRAAQAPSTAFASLSAPARLVLLAEQTRDVEHGRADRAYALLRRYILATAALGIVITPLLWIAMPTLIRWAIKSKYVPAANAFRVMLLAAVVQLVFAWTKSFPVSIGRPGLRTVGQLLEIAVLVPAVLVLADRYGATGAAAGVLAGALALAAFWSVALLGVREAT